MENLPLPKTTSLRKLFVQPDLHDLAGENSNFFSTFVRSDAIDNLKVALVQDWLTVIGGSEKVFTEIASLFPNADIYTLVARDETIEELGLKPEKVFTSFIQNLPFSKSKYRSYLPLFPLAIERFDLSEYDLVISSSHAVAKGVLTHANQVHICYCHSPIRYAWDLHHQYMKESKLDKGFKGFIAQYILHNIRQWDLSATPRVDYFISNSDYIGRRIKKVYGRDSTTIYPNVAVEDFDVVTEKDDYYFACSRFVPYKKMDLIVRAFAEMPDKKLIVIGDGPDMEKVKKMAAKNTIIMGHQPFSILRRYMSKAKAMVFAAEEDFGIVPVEAQACGTPVIAFDRGGVKESVIDGLTGLLYPSQTVQSIQEAIKKFETMSFDTYIIRKNAERFSTARFSSEMYHFVESKLTKANQLTE